MPTIRLPLPFGVAYFDPNDMVDCDGRLVARQITVVVEQGNTTITLLIETTDEDMPHCTHVQFASADGYAVNPAALRAVKLTRWADEASHATSALLVINEPGLPVVTGPAGGSRGPRRNLARLRAVASIYNGATDDKPMKAVEAAYPDRPYRTLARWVQHARREGFILEGK